MILIDPYLYYVCYQLIIMHVVYYSQILQYNALFVLSSLVLHVWPQQTGEFDGSHFQGKVFCDVYNGQHSEVNNCIHGAFNFS